MKLKLKWLRQAFDYSQQEVAKYLSLSRVSYTNLENEERKISAMELLKISDLYNIDMRTLMISPLKTIEAQFKQDITIDECKHYKTL